MQAKRLTVYIGRFSPFHNGHAKVLARAMSISDGVLVIVGSVDRARDAKNPWSFTERRGVIDAFAARANATAKRLCPVEVVGVRDFPQSDSMWIAKVRALVAQAAKNLELVTGEKPKVFITGADRDASTFYLKLFPGYGMDIIDEVPEVSAKLSATRVREIYFQGLMGGRELPESDVDMLLRAFVPLETMFFLNAFRKTEDFQHLREEISFMEQYRRTWAGLPYPVIFHTVDCVVVQTGHVLLVRRRSTPGKGLLALPGGFLRADERLLDSALRELREETRIKVPDAALRGSIVCDMVFDAPDRSLRGRTITTAFLFKLADHLEDGRVVLPKVKGGDDAEKAFWMPIDEVLAKPELFFEDHHGIIETMLGRM